MRDRWNSGERQKKGAQQQPFFFLQKKSKSEKRNSEHLPVWTDGILTTPHAAIHFQELKAVAQNNSWKSKRQVSKLPEHILLLC